MTRVIEMIDENSCTPITRDYCEVFAFGIDKKNAKIALNIRLSFKLQQSSEEVMEATGFSFTLFFYFKIFFNLLFKNSFFLFLY